MMDYKTEPNADLVFSFPDETVLEELDKQGMTLPQGMQFIDFFIEREHDVLIVEVKDPSNACARPEARKEFLEKMENKELIYNELIPKARDSYTALHLWKRDTKPFKYIVLLGLDSCGVHIDAAALVNLKDRIMKKSKKEAWEPWSRNYIQDCMVLTVDTWNTVFPAWPVRRLSQGFMTMDEACGIR